MFPIYSVYKHLLPKPWESFPKRGAVIQNCPTRQTRGLSHRSSHNPQIYHHDVNFTTKG